MSTARRTAKSQKYVGADAATRPNGTFCHTVQLVYVGGTGGRVDARPGKEVGESGGEELARVIRVKRADEALRF
eukprot:2349035-Pleurochrysis_carterae.AAC.1